jgi:hypothetical protein
MFIPLPGRSAKRFQRLLGFLAPISIVAFVLLLPISGVSQIRLHDTAKDDLAKKTRDAYNEFTKEDNTVFDKMISNTLALKGATLAHLMELNQQTRRDTVNIIPVSTWKKLREEDVPRTQKQFLDAYNASKIILDPLAASLPTLQAALADANTQLAAKTLDKNAKVAALNVEAPKLQQLKDSLDALKDAVVVSGKPVKNLSDLRAQFTTLKGVWSNITEVRDWLDAAEKASNAPGLQLTILDLGVQHEQFIVERLKLQVEQAKAAEARAKRIDERLKVVWGDGATVRVSFLQPDGSTRTEDLATQGLFGQIYRALAPAAGTSDDLRYPFVTDETEQVLQTIGRLATVAESEVDGRRPDATMKLRDLMDVLSRYVALVGYHQYLLLADTIEAGVDANLFSIRLSAINIREREMLVAHGLDGLAAYHAGGLKPEEIANFFRAAQSIALGVLAGRNK